jgi:predicted nucleic acid-binding protein
VRRISRKSLRKRALSETVYADSNVFILPAIHGDSSRGSAATKILRKIESGEVLAYTSYLTWDEVAWVVYRVLGKADSIEMGKKLIRFPNLRFVEVSESVIAKSQSLVEKYHLRPRDAIHCASAVSREISLFLSDDGDFDVVKEIKRVPLESLSSLRLGK